MKYHSLLLAVLLAAFCSLLIGCGGNDAETKSPSGATRSPDGQSGEGKQSTKLIPSELTSVKPTDATPAKQTEVARLAELADAAEAQGEYAHAAAYLQAALPLAISLEPTLRATIEIAESGHSPSDIKTDMLSESAILLVARQIMRQNNPFDATEQVVPEQLGLSIAAGLTVSPQSDTGEPPFTVIVECNAKHLEWDPIRNWQIAKQAVDGSVQNFIRRSLDKREKALLAQREQSEKTLASDRLAVTQAEDAELEFAKRHPGVAIEDLSEAQTELDAYYKIAKDTYEKHDLEMTTNQVRQESLTRMIADIPDEIKSRTLSKEGAKLQAYLPALKETLEYHLIELRRPETHEKVIEVRAQIKEVTALLENMPAEHKYDVTKGPNQKKLKAKLDLAELNEKLEADKQQGLRMRDVMLRYAATRQDFKGHRQKYQALLAEVEAAKGRRAATEALLRSVNDQLRSPTASQIRYVAAPPQFPTWTKMKNRLNSLLQQAGQFGQIQTVN